MSNGDIVERLRKHVNNRGDPSLQNGAWEMMLEAADEIERLRSQVDEATILIYDLAGLELGSAERAMAWLDEHPLPAPPVEAKSDLDQGNSNGSR